MWQHEETGNTGFVDRWQVENGWEKNNPRLLLVAKLYTRPQQPLSDEQIYDLHDDHTWRFEGLDGKEFKFIARAIEAAHGITKEPKT